MPLLHALASTIRWDENILKLINLLIRCTATQELAQRYGFPDLVSTSPYWVAILELGGGFAQADLESYCEQLGIRVPKVEVLNLPGSSNRLGSAADGEVALDMQVFPGS